MTKRPDNIKLPAGLDSRREFLRHFLTLNVIGASVVVGDSKAFADAWLDANHRHQTQRAAVRVPTTHEATPHMPPGRAHEGVSVLEFAPPGVTLGTGQSQTLADIYGGTSSAALSAAQTAYPYAFADSAATTADMSREIDEVVISHTAAHLTTLGATGPSTRPAYVLLPPGQYLTTQTIFLDAPNNLRAGKTSSLNQQFSSGLIGTGNGGDSGGYGQGSMIRPVDNSYCAVMLGPGRRQTLSQIGALPRNYVDNRGDRNYANYRGTNHKDGIGFAVAGRASNTLFDRLFCSGFYRGSVADPQGFDNLADSNTWFKCLFNNAAIGIDIHGNQAYINSVIECSLGATIAVNDPLNRGVNVVGGDMSCTNTRIKSYIPRNLSAFSSAFYLNDATYRFSFVVQPAANTSDAQLLTAGVITIGALQTAHYGTVPFIITSFNSKTNVVTCVLQPSWLGHAFSTVNPLPAAVLEDLNNELAAVPKVYIGERAITFYGSAIRARGFHLENPNSVTCMAYSFGGYGAGIADFEDLINDYGIAQDGWAHRQGDEFGYYLLQSVFGYIELTRSAGPVRVARTRAASELGGGASAVLVDIHGQSSARFMSEAVDWGPNLNVRAFPPGGGADDVGDRTLISTAQGAGEFDVTPFKSRLPDQTDVLIRTQGAGRNRYIGYFPDMREVSLLSPANYALLTAGAGGKSPAADQPLGSYPVIFGATEYHVASRFSSDLPKRYAAPIFGGTYGKNLTLQSSWFYKAGTNVVKFSAGSDDMKWAFPGLVIGLDYDNSATYWLYVITCVYPIEGYLNVCLIPNQPRWPYGQATTMGRQGRIYAGRTPNFSIIYQQPCALTAIG